MSSFACVYRMMPAMFRSLIYAPVCAVACAMLCSVTLLLGVSSSAWAEVSVVDKQPSNIQRSNTQPSKTQFADNQASDVNASDIIVSATKISGTKASGIQLSGIKASNTQSVEQQADADNLVADVKQVTPASAKAAVDAVVNSDAFAVKQPVKGWKANDELDSNDEEKSLIEAILDWLLNDDDSTTASERNATGAGIATVAEFIMWGAFAVLAIFLLTQVGKWSGWLGNMRGSLKKNRYEQPTELFGLALDAESLPIDIIQQVKADLQAGDMRKAVALLYQASLIRLIHDEGVEIPASATERECQQLVTASQPAVRVAVFDELTQVWLQVAYAKDNPSTARVLSLCDAWSPQFTQAVMVEHHPSNTGSDGEVSA